MSRSSDRTDEQDQLPPYSEEMMRAAMRYVSYYTLHQPHQLVCACGCGLEFTARALNTRFASPACRTRDWRAQRKARLAEEQSS